MTKQERRGIKEGEARMERDRKSTLTKERPEGGCNEKEQRGRLQKEEEKKGE